MLIGESSPDATTRCNEQTMFNRTDENEDHQLIKKAEMEKLNVNGGFQMPLHYPRYTKSDYEKMEEWKVDMLLREYGLVDFTGSLDEKRTFAMGAFLWPDQF
ncbi:hypothetical protein BUALT_Bualt18G0074000 [Buddleja alternifolia]|uniref:DUF7722 domain-containing protein n=1 Tax=Buddleja alternifolia TaxID=168488 RepID=A0AAV6WB54_9LAMI|nr:hypothetical protein BUALT_Bualt18G0074000 [Buddleja alternifolia]